MKSIRLENIGLPDNDSNFSERKKYSVYLGNGYRARFTRKRDAAAFLAECSRVLTYQMHQINFEIGYAWSEYRAAWPYFRHNKKTMSSKLLVWERSIRDAIQVSETALERASKLYPTQNHNHFTFMDLKLAAKELQKAFDLLFQLYRSRSSGAEAARMQGAIRRLAIIIQDIDNYPQQIAVPDHVELAPFVLRAV